ncbi:hypothetical protein K7432_003564 [Basidiobolus ranarum]|uniref:LYR motif-containing protein Cup1-like N-terminal domain-containing protein n=1 Tax=Basidiobolus ranarum TaxID=34480 RepID=A0ABR2WZS1_9FUNG
MTTLGTPEPYTCATTVTDTILSTLREYVLERVRERFRTYQQWSYLPRIISKLSEGRKGLKHLKQANENDSKSVMRIMELAYSRRGKRKHDLLKPFMTPPPNNEFGENPKILNKPVHPILHQLLKSQLKSIELGTPPDTSLTAVRVRNMKLKHHERNLSAVVPPLPKEFVETIEKKAQFSDDNSHLMKPRFMPGKNHDGLGQLQNPAIPPRARRRYFQKLLTQIPIVNIDSNNNPSRRIIIEKSPWAVGVRSSTINNFDLFGLNPDELNKKPSKPSKKSGK